VKINISDKGDLVIDESMAINPMLSSDDILEIISATCSEIISFCEDRNINKIKIIGVAKACLPIMTSVVFLLGKRCIDYDFLVLESYKGEERTNDIKVRYKPKVKFCKNEAVLIVDTILDTGYSMKKAVSIVKELGADIVLTCALIKKNRTDNICVYPNLDFVGWVSPDVFMVGYGLDDDGYYRNIPAIYNLQELKKYKNDRYILDTIIYNNVEYIYEEEEEGEIEEEGDE